MSIFSRAKDELEEKLRKLREKYPKVFIDEKLKSLQEKTAQAKRGISDKLDKLERFKEQAKNKVVDRTADLGDRLGEISDKAYQTYEEHPTTRAIKERSLEPLREPTKKAFGMKDVGYSDEQKNLREEIKKVSQEIVQEQGLTGVGRLTSDRLKELEKQKNELENKFKSSLSEEQVKTIEENQIARTDFVMGAAEPLRGVAGKGKKIFKNITDDIAKTKAEGKSFEEFVLSGEPGKIQTTSVLDLLETKIKKSDLEQIRFARETVDDLKQDINTKESAVKMVKDLGYDEYAEYLGFLADNNTSFKMGEQTKSQLKKLWDEATPKQQSAKSKELSDPVSNYIKKQISKRRETKKTPSSFLGFVKEGKSKLVDFASPIEDAFYKAQKKFKFEVLPEKDITNQIDRTLRAPSIGVQFMKDKGLEKVVQTVENLDEFDQYLIARHAKDLREFGIKTGRNVEKDTQLIEELSPIYEEQAKKVTQYSQDLLNYISDAGLISKETAEALKNKYPNYVPFNRVFNELEKTKNLGTGGGVSSLSKQSVVKKIIGSEREVESPLESLLSKTNDAFTQGEKNKTAAILAQYRKLPGFEDLIKEGEGTHTFSYLDNGTKRTFATTKEMAEAAKSLNVQQLGLLGKMFALPTRVARLGITGVNLPFVAANIVRDLMFSATTSKASARSIFSLPKALFEAVRHGDVFDDMMRQGALNTSFDIAREQIPATLKKTRAGKSKVSKILYTVTSPKELLRAVEDIVGRSEEVSRIAQFEGAKSQAIKKGLSEERANIIASKAARENSVNFMRRGEWGSVLNSAFLYFNAGIQGVRTWGRALKERPIEAGSKFIATFGLPLAAITAWNLNDPKRREVYEDIAESEKENSMIIVPNNAVKDENNRWNVIKIPLTPGTGDAAQIFRHAVESVKDYDPVAFEDIYKSAVGSISPIGTSSNEAISTLTPQAIKPTIESITNRNFFFGSDIVPQSKEDLPPELQTKESTTGTAKVIGDKFGASPIKVDAFLKATFGSIAPQIQRQTDKLLAKAGVIDEDEIKGVSVAEAIAKRFNSAYGNAVERKKIDELSKKLDKEKEESHLIRIEAEEFVESLEGKSKEEKIKALKELASRDELLFDKTVDVITDNKLGVTYSDRLIKQLNVRDGNRAKYIVGELNEMETSEEKKEYLKDLRSKKILTDEVLKQVKYLIKNQR